MDLAMMNWIKSYAADYVVIASKADQLNIIEKQQSLDNIRGVFDLPENKKIIPISAMKKSGRDELWDIIQQKFDLGNIKE